MLLDLAVFELLWVIELQRMVGSSMANALSKAQKNRWRVK
jgi:hypothetical protein